MPFQAQLLVKDTAHTLPRLRTVTVYQTRYRVPKLTCVLPRQTYMHLPEQGDLRCVIFSRTGSISRRCDYEYPFSAMRWCLVYDFDESPSTLLDLFQIGTTLSNHTPYNFIITKESENGLRSCATSIRRPLVRSVLVFSMPFRSIVVAMIMIATIWWCTWRIIGHISRIQDGRVDKGGFNKGVATKAWAIIALA